MSSGVVHESPGMQALGMKVTFPTGAKLGWTSERVSGADGKEEVTLLRCMPEGGADDEAFRGFAVVAEVTLGSEDIADLRKTFDAQSDLGLKWPNYTVMLQCPVCCKCAVPDDTEGERNARVLYLLIAHNVAQPDYTTRTICQRLLYRLCCPECFAFIVPNSKGLLEKIHAQHGQNSKASPCYQHVLEFEASGKAQAYRNYYQKVMAEAMAARIEALPKPKGLLAGFATLAVFLAGIVASVGVVAYLPFVVRALLGDT